MMSYRPMELFPLRYDEENVRETGLLHTLKPAFEKCEKIINVDMVETFSYSHSVFGMNRLDYKITLKENENINILKNIFIFCEVDLDYIDLGALSDISNDGIVFYTTDIGDSKFNVSCFISYNTSIVDFDIMSFVFIYDTNNGEYEFGFDCYGKDHITFTRGYHKPTTFHQYYKPNTDLIKYVEYYSKGRNITNQVNRKNILDKIIL